MAGWSKKPLLGLMGLSDGDPVVHEKSKDVVQHQLDVIKAALEKDGRVDVVVADNLVTSVASARAEAEKLKAKGVDGTIFSYGVFAWPNFSAIAAKYGQGPYLLAAQLNPDWPGMVAMLAAGGALNQQGITHFRAYGDFNDPEFPKQHVAMAGEVYTDFLVDSDSVYCAVCQYETADGKTACRGLLR